MGRVRSIPPKVNLRRMRKLNHGISRVLGVVARPELGAVLGDFIAPAAPMPGSPEVKPVPPAKPRRGGGLL